MTEINVNKIVGKHPNEIWLRTGQFFCFCSIFSFLGISAFGIEAGVHTDLAPFVVLAAGIFMMIYGTRLRKNYLEDKQKHDLAILEADKTDD